MLNNWWYYGKSMMTTFKKYYQECPAPVYKANLQV